MKILIIDEDPLSNEVMKNILTLFGYDVKTFIKSPVALESIKTDDSFDVIITYFNMNNYNGLNITHAVKSRNNDIPVVIVSSPGNHENYINDIKKEADLFLEKPLNIKILIEFLKNSDRDKVRPT